MPVAEIQVGKPYIWDVEGVESLRLPFVPTRLEGPDHAEGLIFQHGTRLRRFTGMVNRRRLEEV